MTLNPLEKPKLGSRFESALVYATRLHANQLRKGSQIPYITHLLSVAALVLEDGGSEDEAIAALLHDAIEDQGGAKIREEIRQQFGEKVADIVDGCTESEVMPKPPWKERKQEHIERMRHACLEVRRVSQADKLHNARSILADWYREGETVWNKFKAGKEGTLWYFRSLLAVYQQAGSSCLTQELERAIAQLEKVAA
ncbi:HD domain-containing protein [Aetokthonos hydrillicola Thurmond2011]|jgi:(p)ppGpp synthase/HD superfamily hydrolase|uniref:HD domain-containing protein n=1 Tax=Aetokthonos hydrillicola Thurmond2011 TaxID=2712845 RepID=A0AAP5I4L3_9CYAN|nr:HD domain-containing protein [Aetokthonos hydrillicola]MBO3458999.1 HD domain-containing protein [Aetokthonos hydrillicola CCALA 1050]MBW4589107.1 HD domain-containing protein [Aetokthonos hydrillicola CCALA 1050]MDR9894937.1 HD domain-containing protein [Aetokthonos hydrillicola Thurmond2011]